MSCHIILQEISTWFSFDFDLIKVLIKRPAIKHFVKSIWHKTSWNATDILLIPNTLMPKRKQLTFFRKSASRCESQLMTSDLDGTLSQLMFPNELVLMMRVKFQILSSIELSQQGHAVLVLTFPEIMRSLAPYRKSDVSFKKLKVKFKQKILN